MGNARAPIEIPVNAVPYARLCLRLKCTLTMAVEGVKSRPVPRPIPTPWLRKTLGFNVRTWRTLKTRVVKVPGSIGLPVQVTA